MVKRREKPKISSTKSISKKASPAALKDLFFTKCEDKQHLYEWVKLYWNVNLPNKTISRYSNCNPLDALWEVYKACLYDREAKDILHIAPRGGGKCVKAGTLISVKDKGLIKIEEIQKDDIVFSGKDWRRVLETYQEGKKTGYGIKTENGFSLVGSKNHRVMVSDESSGIRWKFLNEITESDHVMMMGCDHSSIDTSSIEYDKGFLVGILSDNQHTLIGERSEYVELYTEKTKLLQIFKEVTERIFNVIPERKPNCDASEVKCQELIDLLNSTLKNGSLISLSHSDEFLAGFISGVFDINSAARLKIFSVNKNLVYQFMMILAKFGVFASFFKWDTLKGRIFYISEVLNELPKVFMPRCIHTSFLGYNNKYYLNHPRNAVNFFINAVKQNSRSDFNLMSVREGKYITRDVLKRICDIPDSLKNKIPEQYERVKFIQKAFFQKVKKIWTEEAEFYDLNVEEDHTYVSNGMLSHNTLGVAIMESILMFHDRRGVVHIGAIEKQAKRAYSYFQSFLQRNKAILSAHVEKSVIEKTTLIVDDEQVTLECLPCTTPSLNGPHEAFVCNDPESLAVINGSYSPLKDVQVGDKIMSLDHLLEWKETIIKSCSRYVKPCFYLTFEDGREYKAAALHQVLTPRGWMSIKDLRVSDRVYINQQSQWASSSGYQWKEPKLDRAFSKSALIGMMLGDGYLSLNNQKSDKIYGNPRFYVGHGRKQWEYLKYCSRVISSLVEIKNIKEKMSGYGSKIRELRTASSQDLAFLREIFRPAGSSRKTIPTDISKYIDKVALAFWFMDDGSCSKSSASLAVCSFTYEECCLLVTALKDNFGFSSAKISETSKGYRLITLDTNDTKTMAEIIWPFTHPSMQYKLGKISPKVCYSLFTGEEKSYQPGFPNEKDTRAFRKWRKDIKSILSTQKIVNKTYIGHYETIQIEVEGENYFDKNFICNGLISHNCMDELDTLSPEGLNAYKQINGIPVKHKLTGAPPVKIGISTRKSSYGLVQKQIDTAAEQGRIIKMWNQIDLTEKCYPSRHGKDKVTIFVDQSRMHHVSLLEYNKLSDEKKKEYIAYEATDGCMSCPLFSCCLGDLKNQSEKMTAENSTLISSIDDVILKIKGADVDWVLAELMCLKPSTEGIVFKEFERSRHVASWDAMWKRLTKEDSPDTVDEIKFISECHKRKVPIYAGLDWGWAAPSTFIAVAIDHEDNVYVLRSFGLTKVNDPTFIHIVKSKFHKFYRVQMYYPDVANGSAVDLMKSAGLPVASRIDKSENLGVQVIKRVMNIPGTSDSKFMIANENCDMIIHEIERFHYEKDASGTIIDGKFANEYNHTIDPLRYILTAILGKSRFIISHDGVNIDVSNPLLASDGSYLRAPNFFELASENCIPVNVPDSKPFNRDNIDDDTPDGFLWSF